MAHARIGKPRRHAPGADGIGDSSRQRPNLLDRWPAASGRFRPLDGSSGSAARESAGYRDKTSDWLPNVCARAAVPVPRRSVTSGESDAQDADGSARFFGGVASACMRDSSAATPELWPLAASDCNWRGVWRRGSSSVRNKLKKSRAQTVALNVEFRHGKRLGKQSGRKSGAGFADRRDAAKAEAS